MFCPSLFFCTLFLLFYITLFILPLGWFLSLLVFINTYIHAYTHTHTHTHARTHTHTHRCTYTHTHTYVYVCACVWANGYQWYLNDRWQSIVSQGYGLTGCNWRIHWTVLVVIYGVNFDLLHVVNMYVYHYIYVVVCVVVNMYI